MLSLHYDHSEAIAAMGSISNTCDSNIKFVWAIFQNPQTLINLKETRIPETKIQSNLPSLQKSISLLPPLL